MKIIEKTGFIQWIKNKLTRTVEFDIDLEDDEYESAVSLGRLLNQDEENEENLASLAIEYWIALYFIEVVNEENNKRA